MNKKVKIATLVAFTAAFSVFSVKPAMAFDLGKTLGGAIKSAEKATGKPVDKVAGDALKAAVKVIEPKGPLKIIQIVDIPSEYESYYAQIFAGNIENSLDNCMPSYLYIAYSQSALVDSVTAGKVLTQTPCDEKKRLVSVIFTKTKDENNTTGAGFTYVKGSGLDACKSKETMPTYALTEKQTFSFKDFVKNEDCKALVDAAENDKSKSKSKK